MDNSHILHFLFSFFIPIGWGILFFPFRRSYFRTWPRFLWWILGISFVCVCAKEFYDQQLSTNDLVSDALGFFFGTVFLTLGFILRSGRIDRAEEKVVDNTTISLRSTLKLFERIEKKSGDFYTNAANKLPEKLASALCQLLAKDAYRRANRIYYLLSSWKKISEPEGLNEAVDKAFSSEHLFSLASLEGAKAEQVLKIALEHEKAKRKIFAKFETAFQEDWKILQLEGVLRELDGQVYKLERCLLEVQRLKRETEL